MHVTVEELSPVEKKLAVQLDWPFVAARLDEAYRELGRGVTLRGFRKGKVPRPMLEKLFARQVENELVHKLVQETFTRATTEHEIEPMSDPVIADVQLEKGSGFRYSARVEVRAPFEPKDYDGVELEPPLVRIEDAEVDRALDEKREELAELKHIEGRDTLGPHDVVFVNVVGEVAGKPIKREGLVFDLGRPGSDPIPGLSAKLLGVPLTAADLAIELPIPGDEGQLASLKVTLSQPREKVLPALDDDLAKDTGEAETLEELRRKVREKLIAERERSQQSDLKHELVRELVRRNQFPVPPGLIERQTEVLLQRFRLGMVIRGVDPKSAAAFGDESVKEDLRRTAGDEIRASFLLDAIANREKIEVSEAEVEKRLAEMAHERDKSVARLKAELQKEGRIEQIRRSLRDDKTLDMLMTRANIKSPLAP